MKISEYDYTKDVPLNEEYLDDLDLIQYLFYDLGSDKNNGNYAYAYDVSIDEVKQWCTGLIQKYACSNSEIILKAFDDVFNDWEEFVNVLEKVFNVWYEKVHEKHKK